MRCYYDVSTGYGLAIFLNLYSAELNKIVEATAPVNPYDNRTAASASVRSRTEMEIRASYGRRKLIAGQM